MALIFVPIFFDIMIGQVGELIFNFLCYRVEVKTTLITKFPSSWINLLTKLDRYCQESMLMKVKKVSPLGFADAIRK